MSRIVLMILSSYILSAGVMLSLKNMVSEPETEGRQSSATESTVDGSTASELKVGCFRVDPCSQTGKRIYLLHMIILPFIPIAALIVQNLYTMVSAALVNVEAATINKQVNICRLSVSTTHSK
jgi:hypothetical protein